MPLPTPSKNETQDDFISRCMSNETMKEDFPDNKQRVAVCFSQWKKKKVKKDSEMKKETRLFEIELEERQVGDTEEKKLVGYAARFNKLSEDLGGFREKIKPGAFSESITSDDIRALFNHDTNFVLGRSSAGTLELSEDRKGLRMSCSPPDAQWARDLVASVKRGDISQMSFGFQTLDDKWEKKDGDNIRTLEKCKLFDVSVVTFPAYPDTEVGLRSLESWETREEKPNPDEAVAQPEPDKEAIELSMRQRLRELAQKEKQMKPSQTAKKILSEVK